MPFSSSGESWLRPMRSNLQHAKTEEQYSNASTGAICCCWTKEASVDLKSPGFHPTNSPCRHHGVPVERDRNWRSTEGDKHMTLSIGNAQTARRMGRCQRFGLQRRPWLTCVRKRTAWQDLRVGADELDVRRLNFGQSFHPTVPVRVKGKKSVSQHERHH